MMDFFRYTFSFIWALLITFVPQKTYVEGLTGQPTTFLPNEVQTENDITVSKLLFRGLFAYTKDGVLVDDLADSYDISKDGLTYTVYLKKNQKWTNGSEITADDLLYSAYSTSQLREIATDKIDKYTIRYTLPNKYAPFLSLLTSGVLPAIPENDRLFPVSSGPYQVVRIKREGPIIREVVLQKIDSTFNVGRVSFRYYSNDKELFTAFKLGEILGFVSTDNLTWPTLSKRMFYQRGIYYSLVFNLRNAKLNKLDVRKKLAAATPVFDLDKNLGIPVEGPISESIFTNETLNYNLYNPNQKENLNLKLTLVVPDTEVHLQIANKVKEAWQKIGVELTIKPVKSEDIEKDIVQKRDFEVLLFGQQVSRDPDRYVLWHSTRVDAPGLNLSGFENIRSDRALEEGRNALTVEERKRHYAIFQQVIYDNSPSVFLYHPALKFYVNKRVKTGKDFDLYYSRDRFLDLQNWDII